MLKHNLLMIFRNFKRNKSTFFINLIGLSTGLACAILIYLWVNDELNVDKFHEKDSQLYKVMRNQYRSDGIRTKDCVSSYLAQELKDEMPEVENATAVNYMTEFMDGPRGILSAGEEQIFANGQFADENYFQVFSFPLIHGNKKSVLYDKNSIVITEELSERIFKTTEDIIGKTINWKHDLFEGTFQISGISENPPSNSTVQYDVIFNYQVLIDNHPEAGIRNNGYADTYLILKKGTSVESFNEKISDYYKIKYPSKSKYSLFIQQYSQKYLHGKYENGVSAGGRIEYVRMFSIIALLILFIACINFINLSTAKASRRIKEVGVKKVFGVKRKTLILQFLGESILMTFLSMFIAIILVESLIPQFNEITGKHLTLNSSLNFILFAIEIIIIIGLLAGSYPALYLSGLNSVTLIKGKINSSINELWVRKGLVIFQFTISVVLIVTVIVINKQKELIQTKNLGYSRDNIISFERKGRFQLNYDAFMSELKSIPGVLNASNMNGSILNNRSSGGRWTWKGITLEQKTVLPVPKVGYDFIEMHNIELVEGRAFSRDFSNEQAKVILNEAAVKMMGFKDPVGEIIKDGSTENQIIGVVKNFHINSIYENLKPCIMKLSLYGKNIFVKLRAGEERATIDKLTEFYKKFHPEFPFEFSFLDDDFQALYESEDRVGILSKYFAGTAIIISCLGLFGLAAFTAERRRKEIGIRKVLGSSEFGIIYLLSSDFSKMVLAAITIALPISYLIARHWLNGFAYKIDLELWYFLSAGFITLLIAWLTVGTQAIKAATANPVESLRNE